PTIATSPHPLLFLTEPPSLSLSLKPKVLPNPCPTPTHRRLSSSLVPPLPYLLPPPLWDWILHNTKYALPATDIKQVKWAKTS
ncbi:hypothetical protein M8C21_012772, partial [Ambrosia artemisiifolia]